MAACGFVVFYLVTDFAVSLFAAGSLPLPTDPVDQAREWFGQNAAAAVLMGLCQTLSVAFLAWLVSTVGDVRARIYGFIAVGLMVVSSCCVWILAGVAPQASLGLVGFLRQANFLTGGVAHVLALGLFVFLTCRAGSYGRPLRILAAVSLGAGVLSLSSLAFSQGAAFILLGRLLAMAWVLSAAVIAVRRGRRGI